MSAQQAADVFPLEGRDLTDVSREEIVRSIPYAPRVHGSITAPPLARIASSAIVKWGRNIQLSEARNMLYVARHTSINLPRVIDAWEVEDAPEDWYPSRGYILMEYIKGITLDDCWDELCEPCRHGIQVQLVNYITQLQKLDFELPGPIDGEASELHIFTGNGACQFKSSADMEKWYNDGILICHDHDQALHIPPGAFSGKFEKLVMCHLDFNPRNMIIDDDGKLWLLDWGLSGAYPPWFEKANLAWGTDKTKWETGLLELIGHETYQEEVNLILSIGYSLIYKRNDKPLLSPTVEIVEPLDSDTEDFHGERRKYNYRENWAV
jgi:aminoglycoside phosphotransferase (APT) family kinase protein